MIKNLKFKIKNSVRGITLIEILVVVFIFVLLSGILVANFPKIRRQFALTRAVYKMAQDLRKTQDLGLSGKQMEGVKGYGVYINLNSLGNKKYIIYADRNNDSKYDALGVYCEQSPSDNQDCIVEAIDFSQTELGIVINRIEGTTNNQQVDINFKPPNPTVTITDLSADINNPRVQIIFALEFDQLTYRTVLVNTSGLIEIK
ncbi:MAG: prepilin-type N-terminal cleavage/methylation domain-containing protein [Candidatus Staskawiczbacteria bacterium]|nr:prepilin-type N-terminal cleavage/methylation domain-containing protein [Candidatus Staskawiczbacteria bacterium]